MIYDYFQQTSLSFHDDEHLKISSYSSISTVSTNASEEKEAQFDEMFYDKIESFLDDEQLFITSPSIVINSRFTKNVKITQLHKFPSMDHIFKESHNEEDEEKQEGGSLPSILARRMGRNERTKSLILINETSCAKLIKLSSFNCWTIFHTENFSDCASISKPSSLLFSSILLSNSYTVFLNCHLQDFSICFWIFIKLYMTLFTLGPSPITINSLFSYANLRLFLTFSLTICLIGCQTWSYVETSKFLLIYGIKRGELISN